MIMAKTTNDKLMLVQRNQCICFIRVNIIYKILVRIFGNIGVRCSYISFFCIKKSHSDFYLYL